MTVIGQQRGKDTKDNIARFFGSAHPEGFRKALRLMQQADKFKRPIITFVDTKGAYPGNTAEERGQSEAIARNLRDMAALGVPVICVIIGEGGSGGALALAVGNRVLMLEHAIYSAISPNGAASILWKDASKADQAAEAMKITAKDLLGFEVIEEIVPELGRRRPQKLRMDGFGDQRGADPAFGGIVRHGQRSFERRQIPEIPQNRKIRI